MRSVKLAGPSLPSQAQRRISQPESCEILHVAQQTDDSYGWMPANAWIAVASLSTFGASQDPRSSPLTCEATASNVSRRCAPAARSALARPCRTAAILAAARHFDRSSWSAYARASAKLGGQTIFGCPCALRWSQRTVLAASISFCEMNSLGVSSKTSSPRAISELYMAPLYQYTDHEPPSPIRVESDGPRSWYAISFGLEGSVQSNTEMPP